MSIRLTQKSDTNYYNESLQRVQYVAPAADKYSCHKNLANIMHINCRSIVNKIAELQILLKQVPVTFLALTETWLSDDTSHHLSIYRICCCDQFQSWKDRWRSGHSYKSWTDIPYYGS